MPRPSRNLDQALLAAGRDLFPARGCAGMSVREVADAAGVNLGMFHYHFKSRDAFLRALMQQAYEEMFATLTLQVVEGAEPVANLRKALQVLGRFARDNRPFLARVFIDALSGEQCARVAVPVPQVIGLCGGALVMPILLGGALLESGALEKPTAAAIEASFLTDAGIEQRIDLALRAISLTPQPLAPAPRSGKARRKT